LRGGCGRGQGNGAAYLKTFPIGNIATMQVLPLDVASLLVSLRIPKLVFSICLLVSCLRG
jgi:hypothetical protein